MDEQSSGWWARFQRWAEQPVPPRPSLHERKRRFAKGYVTAVGVGLLVAPVLLWVTGRRGLPVWSSAGSEVLTAVVLVGVVLVVGRKLRGGG